MFASELDRPQGPPNVRDSSWFPANLLLLRRRGLSHPDLQDYSPWSPGEGGRVHQKGASVGAALSGVCLIPVFSVRPLEANFRSPRTRKQGQRVPSFPHSPTSPFPPHFLTFAFVPLAAPFSCLSLPHPSFFSPLSDAPLTHLSC